MPWPRPGPSEGHAMALPAPAASSLNVARNSSQMVTTIQHALDVPLDYPAPVLPLLDGPGEAAPFAARMPSTYALLRDGLRSGIFPGAQLCVARRGEVQASVAVGAARSGLAMTESTLLPWFCCVN